MSIRGLFTSSRRQRIGSMIFAVTLAALSLPKAWAADNPYNLIDAKTISVGTMGDAKPYAFTTADGKFTGFDHRILPQRGGPDRIQGGSGDLHRPGILGAHALGRQ